MNAIKANNVKGSSSQSANLLLSGSNEDDEFLIEMSRLEPALIGRGKEIAKMASVPYSMYSNYRQGRGKNVEVRNKILAAATFLAKQLKTYLNSINL